MPGRGLYEALITEALEDRLGSVDPAYEPARGELHTAEAADRLALHLSRVLERAINKLEPKQRVEVGASLASQLVDVIVKATAANELSSERLVSPTRVLRAIFGRLPDGRSEEILEPRIPLLDTTLLTNAPGEPRIGNALLTEIDSADRIDVVMAFIRRSGMRPMLEALRAHCDLGRALRVLTTTYTGSTEALALDELKKLGAEVRVSYDGTSTRLHAKAWLFERDSGFSTAYIGSSNLTHSAQVSGLEWNVRVSSARNPSVVSKVAAVFESYWNSADFVPYNRDEFLARVEQASSEATYTLSPIELRPEPFQERLLEQIALARQLGRHRNLLVSATGTGKTVMAALDYARLRDTLPRARLLFIAHREEILTQTQATFRHALRDHAFGELWVGGARPQKFEHVFASVQSLSAAGVAHLAPDHFDVVIIDEFHHAGAATYNALLEHLKPRELLGLTATPERADGLPILDWFDGRIAAELRLWDAIDQHRLVPFSYFGVHDGLDFRDVAWKRGRGYDVQGLTNVFTANDAWARVVIAELAKRVDDLKRMRALGFCVSVEHAQFMARVFNEAGVPAVAIWSDTPIEERRQALRDLAARSINIVFSVDLFNEGVDVPSVDTLLMLRPTDSATLFLQQLGRGLRRHTDKTLCTVLDFVGHHRAEFRYDVRLRALLGGSRTEVAAQVEAGFPYLPAGCQMELDRVASDIVLANIRAAVPSQWAGKVKELRDEAKGSRISLQLFLERSGLELDDIYANDKSWSDLQGDAGLPIATAGPHEPPLRRACGRLLHVDDMPRIEVYRLLLTGDAAPALEGMPATDLRLLRMLVSQLMTKVLTRGATLEDGCAILWQHPQVRAEIVELMSLLAERPTHLTAPLDSHAEVPLQVHARYTRLEILAAFGVGDGAKVAAWQTGVRWLEEAKADLLAFTLDKTSGHFSPTTRYRDYAISRELIHWESQSVTRADSDTGLRYQQHAARGSSIMLFARLNTNDRAFCFLGPATYVKHEGELPMAVTWRLQHSLPGDLFASFAAAVA